MDNGVDLSFSRNVAVALEVDSHRTPMILSTPRLTASNGLGRGYFITWQRNPQSSEQLPSLMVKTSSTRPNTPLDMRIQITMLWPWPRRSANFSFGTSHRFDFTLGFPIRPMILSGIGFGLQNLRKWAVRVFTYSAEPSDIE